MEKKEQLTIQVTLTGSDMVKGAAGEAKMLHFTAVADCENFKGKTLPGGVDTQVEYIGETRTLSARYIMEGTDKDGCQCRIFIENNGIFDADGKIKTKPRIITDSKALAYLENAELTGTVTGCEGGVLIQIYSNSMD